MKKKKVNPLQLDKETISQLDEKQLQQIAGGATDEDEVSCGVTCKQGSCTQGNSCNAGGPG